MIGYPANSKFVIQNGAGSPMVTSYSEVIAFDESLSAADHARVIRYLKSRYQIQ
jgi:hypothetical protein